MTRLIKTESDEIKQARELENLLRQRIELQEGLPHLHGWNWYPWAKEFFDSTNRMNFLCAANQISKSSTQIRKCIDWATNKAKWPLLWRTEPRQFWYLYPTREVATIEYYEKWVPDFLPAKKFKDDPQYGWVPELKKGEIYAIHFNSGVSVYFKTYTQDVAHLQTGSCHAIFNDEELPENLLGELTFRLAGTDGYFHMVFTATLGQEIWRKTIEEIGSEEEMFPTALKLQISMYECLKYVDGSDTPWTVERIQQIISTCGSEAEVQRRVYGKFIIDTGLKYPTFSRTRHMKQGHHLPPGWRVYAGVDIGSGGKNNHPAAVCFVAVDPTYRKGRVFKAWRGDQIETTAGDILLKYRELKGEIQVTAQYYDHQARDFYTLSTRMGEPFMPAEKNQSIGEDIINVLFKNDMMVLYENDPEIQKLALELTTLKKSKLKNNARDDLIDSFRFAISKIPWDFTYLSGEDSPLADKVLYAKSDMELRKEGYDGGSIILDGVEEELGEWNEQYGS